MTNSGLSIALTWWPPSAGGSRQAIRGNVRALERAGHDVTLYFSNELGSLESDVQAGEYDAVVMPYIHYPQEMSAYDDVHLHVQLGGFPDQERPELSRYVIEQADTVSALDSSIIAYFQQFWPLDPSNIALIPNAPNRELFERQPRDGIVNSPHEHALVPKLGSPQKGVTELDGIAEASPDVEYHTLYTGDQPNPPHVGPNVTHYPSIPLTAMPTKYRDARVVSNPSSKDILPNTAFEAWMSGRPYVCREQAIGNIQSVPAADLDTSYWGRSVERWHRDCGSSIGEGDHYIGISDEHENLDAAFGRSVADLMRSDELWEQTVTAADAWLDAWADWNWESKGHALTAVIESGGPLA